MAFRHSPEEIKKRIVGYYEDEYPAYLVAEGALWPDDVVPLATFKEVIYGDATTVKEIKAYPALAVTSGDVIAILRAEQGQVLQWQTQMYIRYFLRDSNLAYLEKQLDRHISATLKMFETAPFRTIGGLAQSFEFQRIEVPPSLLPLGATVFIRGIELQYEVRHA